MEGTGKTRRMLSAKAQNYESTKEEHKQSEAEVWNEEIKKRWYVILRVTARFSSDRFVDFGSTKKAEKMLS